MTQTTTLSRDKLADAILSTALDCIIVADTTGRIVEFNPAAERAFGWTRAEILGRLMEDTIVPHHHRHAHHHGMARYLTEGRARVLGRRVEVEGLHADGHVFPVELSITETRMDAAQFFVATLRDITAQRTAEAALLQARASLQAIFDNIPAALYLRDRQDNLVMINAWGAQFLGRDPAEMIGQPMSNFREPQNNAGVRAADEQIARTGQPETREFTYHLPGGDRVGLMTFFPVTDGRGEVTQIGGMLIDVTELHKARLELQQSRASLQAFFDNVPVGIHINRIGPGGLDDQTVEFANDNMGRPYGVTGAELIGMDVYEFYRRHGEIEAEREFDREIIASGQPGIFEGVNPLNGRYESHTRFPIRNAAGQVTHMGGITIDVDAKVRSELQLTEFRNLLETVFDNIPAELYLRELDGTFVMMNRWGAGFYGTDPSGMKGRLASEYDTGDEIAIARVAQERLLATGAPVVQEYNYTVAGRPVVVSNTIFPVRNAEGQIFRIGGFSTDVTELHRARHDMQRAQSALQSFVEQVPVGIHINRLGSGGIADQTVEFLNESICKPYGLQLDKVIGRDPYAVFRNDDVVRIQKDLDRRILKTRKPAVIEMLNPYSKRHERYTRFPIVSADGTVTHIGGTHVDVDDTVRAKAQLDDVRALLESIFNNVPAVLYLRELDGRFVTVNKYGAEVMGLDDTSIGATSLSLDSEEERQITVRAQEQLLATGQPVTQEYRRTVAGREMIVLNSIFPVRDANGQIVRIGGFASDVTELYKARNELQDARNLLQTIFDNVPAELYLRRLDGQYLMANHWALDFYGLTEADLPRLTAETFDTGDGTEVSRQAQRELLATGRPVTREYQHQARGRDVVILNTIFPLRNAEGDIDRIGGVSTDITELHAARNQLRQAAESLHQSEKLAALGQLLAGIAHELNNPLAVVLGRAAILQEKLANTPHAASLQKLREAANRCARIVKTFLAMARQTGPRRQLVDVNDLIDSALELTTYGLRTSDITWNARALAKGIQIEADQDQIVQVLINLIINAQHALQERPGPRSLDIRTDLSPDGAWLTIGIADNGPGVPDAIAHRIFDPFFTTKAVGQGTGLGLSVCKSMIEAHGGRLTLEKTPGGGATFRLSLPTTRGATLDSPKDDAAATLRTRGRILIVDDEVEIAAILADCLSPLGIDCVIATDGNDALRRVAETSFDAVFCDVSMPGMDGITFYHTLKQTNPILAAHLVFISGDVLHRNWDRFKTTVDRPILEKPFDPELIRQAALSLLAPAPLPPTGGH